jgi:formylmethanofuran dehydrogenase subunit E
MKVKPVTNAIGRFNVIREDVATPFFCDRCNEDKKAKNRAEQIDPVQRILCNACYGTVVEPLKG